MSSRPPSPLLGAFQLLISIIGIIWLIAINDRITGPTSQDLVEQLVRREPLPIDRAAYFRWSWWNENEDKRVHAVIDRLASDVRRHADALVANCHRVEPATVLCYADVHVIAVGEICLMIFKGHFDVGGVGYKTRTVNGRSKVPDEYFRSSSLTQWWETHRHLNDDEIRLLVKRWRLEREDAFGYEGDQQRKFFHSKIETNFSSRPNSWSLRGLRPWPEEPIISTPPQ